MSIPNVNFQQVQKILSHPALRTVQGGTVVLGMLSIIKNDPLFYDDSVPFHEKLGHLGGELLNKNLLPNELF